MIDIFITDLSAYNEGTLVGKWVKLPLTPFELSQALSEVLSEGEAISGTDNHEEVFITDYEAEISIGEYDDIYRLNELAEAIEAFSDDDLLKLRFLAYEGYNEREVIDKGLESYDVDIYDFRGNNSFTDTFELLASDFVDEGLFGEIPKALEFYIDHEAIARDLRMDYTEFEPNVIGRVA
ncbi:MAG: antirestriction protein ArdA [Sulfurimonadaceae bacterium]